MKNIKLSNLIPSAIRSISVCALSTLVFACSNFKSADTVLSSASLPDITEEFTMPRQTTTEAPASQWWTQFGDSELSHLISESLKNNHSIRIAQASLEEARALLRNRKYDYIPTVEANISGTRQRQSSDFVAASESRINTVYSEGFEAQWELDLFGRVRNGVRLSQTQVAINEADLSAAQVSVVAEVANAYISLRSNQYLLSVAKQNIEIQQQSLALVARLTQAGSADELSMAQAIAQKELTEASIPALKAQINISLNRLSVLTGSKVPKLKENLSNPQPLPNLPASFSIGTPKDLLRRRPDIRRAEQNLAASVAQYNIRVAELYPSIGFSGGLGFAASDFSRLGEANTSTFLFSPSIHWAAFNLGRVRSQIAAADANTNARLAEFEYQVLTALEETDNCLQSFSREEERRNSLQQAAHASAKAVSLSIKKFEYGSTDYISVLDAQRSHLDIQTQLAKSDAQVLFNIIAIYKSLGGGWHISAKEDDIDH